MERLTRPAVSERSESKRPTSRQLAVACARACDDKKAETIVILDLRKLTFLCDYFIVATTQSERQSRAIADGLQQTLKPKGIRLLSTEGIRDGKWALLDFGDVVVHLFQGEHRIFYDLESLWADAPQVSWKTSRRRAAPDPE